MLNSLLISDQFYNWSDNERFERSHNDIASSSPSSGQTSGPAPTPYPPRLTHRALQAVRQVRLQMSTGPRARTKILLVCQPAWRPTQNGLHPQGASSAGLRLLAELPESPPGAGRDLQHQPRVVAASSEVLNHNAHGAFTFISIGSRISWGSGRQFFAELAPKGLSFICHYSEKGDLR